MKYKEIKNNISKKEFLEKENIVNSKELCLLLYGITEIKDWRWVQDIYMKYLNHQNKWVVIAAIKGFGDLARISKNLDKNKVYMKLKEISKKNIHLQEIIEDTMDDIEIFIPSVLSQHPKP